MAELVLDTSAVLDLTLEKVSVTLPEANCFAPALIDVELVHALRKLVRLKRTTAEFAQRMIKSWMTNDLERIQHYSLLSRVWELRENISTYDATYVALAEQLGLPLMTADLRLARAASSYCEVVTIGAP